MVKMRITKKQLKELVDTTNSLFGTNIRLFFTTGCGTSVKFDNQDWTEQKSNKEIWSMIWQYKKENDLRLK